MPEAMRKVTLEKARDYFDKYTAQTKGGVDSGDSSLVPSVIDPNWSVVLESRDDIIEVVEVPIVTNYGVYAVRDSVGVKAEQRVVFFDNIYFPGLHGYVITIVPTIDYYKHHSDKVSLITRAGEKYGFEGVILVHTFQGEFVELNRYFNGERDPGYYIYAGRPGTWYRSSLIASIDWAMEGFRLVKAVESSSSMTKGSFERLPPGIYGCYWLGEGYECFREIQTASIWGTDRSGEGNPMGGIPTCGDGNSSGGYTPPFDHGRGNPSSGNDGEILDPEVEKIVADKIFKYSLLDRRQQIMVDASMRRLRINCFANNLINSLPLSSVGIKVIPDFGDRLATYEDGSIGLTLDNFDVNETTDAELDYRLIHEIYHAHADLVYYKPIGGINKFITDNGEINAEFEAYTFANLVFGYRNKNTANFQPPVDKDAPWIEYYADEIRDKTQNFTRKLSKDELSDIYIGYRNLLAESLELKDEKQYAPKLDALVNAIDNAVGSNGNCK